MVSDAVGVMLVVIFVVALVGLAFWARWRNEQRKKLWPKTWVHIGLEPPPGIDAAMGIIAKWTPGMTQAGTIEWVKDPFSVGWCMAAGTVDSFEPIHVRVMWNAHVSKTALAHELGHCWSHATKQGFGESPQDKKFVNWINTVNSEIAAALWEK